MSAAESQKKNLVWTEEANPTHFFRERVLEAQSRQHVKLPDNVEFYLVQLLCDFVKTRGEPTEQSDCLALTLKKALESSFGEKVLLFKHIGDTALYFSGFFKESFHRKAFDMSYYTMMGGSAYMQLAGLMRQHSTYGKTMAEIYSEMSNHFAPAVEVLMDVSDHTTGNTEEHHFNALNIYSQWLSTESAHLGRELIKEGILPVPMKKGEVQ